MYVPAQPIVLITSPARFSRPSNGFKALLNLLEPAQELEISVPPRSSNSLLALLMVFSTSSMTSALIVGCVRSTWRMLLESESKRFPKTMTALEAAVPLGAMLTPLGGSVRDGRGASVVANEEKDVAVDGTDSVPGVPSVKIEDTMVDGVVGVPPVEAKDVALDVSDGNPVAPPVELKDVAVDGIDAVPAAPLVEVAVEPGIVPPSEVEERSDEIDDIGIEWIVEVGRLGVWVRFVDPLSVACPFVLVVYTAVPSEPVAVPPLEPETGSDEPDAHSKDHVGDEGEETGLPELIDNPMSVEA